MEFFFVVLIAGLILIVVTVAVLTAIAVLCHLLSPAVYIPADTEEAEAEPEVTEAEERQRRLNVQVAAFLQSSKPDCTPYCSCEEDYEGLILGYVWLHTLRRCDDKSDESHRNVTVYDRWRCWTTFRQYILSHLGPKPSKAHQLERIDPAGNYEPGNVHWVVPTEDQRIKRTRRFITFNGATRCETAWHTMLDIPPRTFRTRLDSGWDIQKALLHPARNDKQTTAQMLLQYSLDELSKHRAAAQA